VSQYYWKQKKHPRGPQTKGSNTAERATVQQQQQQKASKLLRRWRKRKRRERVGRSFCKQAQSCCNKDVAKHKRKSPLQSLTKQNKATVKERERKRETQEETETETERKKERKREREKDSAASL
jgi:hypothetical protein